MLPEAPQTRARTSRHEPAAHALHYGRPGGHPSRRTWRGVIWAILSCSGAVLGGFLGVNWSLWHLEAYISSSYPLGRPLEPLELLQNLPRDVAGDVRLGFHSAVHYSALQYITVHYSALLCITVHYSTLKCITVHYSILQCITVHYSTVQCITVHYSAVQCSTVQYSTVQYSTVQYSTVQ